MDIEEQQRLDQEYWDEILDFLLDGVARVMLGIALFMAVTTAFAVEYLTLKGN